MSLQEHVSAFFHDISVILEEFQVQCQAMGIESAAQSDHRILPTLSAIASRFARPNANPRRASSSPTFSAEDVAEHPPEWLDDQVVALAARTKHPFNQDFRRKLHTVFPSVPSGDMAARLTRLIAAGRIQDVEAPAPQADRMGSELCS
jgi:hypothetical protein